MNERKQIEVVAAVILRDGKIFAAKRKAKPADKPLTAEAGFPVSGYPSGWEFPGGKMEAGEAPEEALKREIREELATEIEVGELLTNVEYDYPQFHLTRHCYLCTIISGQLLLLEHEDARWLTMDELDSVKWLPADVEVINKLQRMMQMALDNGSTSFAEA